MIEPNELSREQLINVVTQIRNLLYMDIDPSSDADFLNPEKEWDGETIEYIAGVFEDFNLVPAERQP
jgi:hypothetical protein